jgi:hypothetical protein
MAEKRNRHGRGKNKGAPRDVSIKERVQPCQKNTYTY